MSKIHFNTVAGIEFKLKWQSQLWQNNLVSHLDCYFGQKVNFWRDFMPKNLQDALMGKTVGDEVEVSLPHDDIIPPYATSNIFTLQNTQFNRNFVRGRQIEPRFGRFYPNNFLQHLSGAVKDKVTPFRCIEFDNTTLQADFNHPLAQQQALKLAAKVHDILGDQAERGGSCNDWAEVVTSQGVGFQTRCQNRATNFLADDPFGRLDSTDDTEFYSKPRIVTHIDAKAIEIITDFYGQFLKPGMKVLDLMSGWKSHIPENLDLASVTGLGLNQEELENNKQLTAHVIHDLKKMPRLPFKNRTFNAVICTASVEYLTHPIEVFAEAARVLKSGGYFLVTFSNRWFPPKVVNIWTDIHEFERMALVMGYLLKSAQFNCLGTYSVRNFPRPADDKHILESSLSDPVFAVYGQKTKR